MAHIVSIDEIKEELPGYNPAESELFHTEAAKLADQKFEQAVKSRSEQTVILMAGGAASGKTEYVSAYLKTRQIIVLDGTLPTFEGAKTKIRKILRARKKIEVHLVLPHSWHEAFFAFLNRERQFPESNFYSTHSNSRKTVLEVAKKYPGIPIKIFVSRTDSVDFKTMFFKEVVLENRPELIEYLRKNQYTESDIRQKVNLQ